MRAKASFELINGNPRALGKQVERQLQKRLKLVYNEYFGAEVPFEEAQSPRFQARLAQELIRGGRVGKSKQRVIGDILSRAWKRKYNEIKGDYAGVANNWGSPAATYPNRQWATRKRSKSETARHSGKPFRYVSPALATGFFRESIDKGLKRGLNDYVTLSSSNFQAGFVVDFSKYERDSSGNIHYQMFTEQLVKLGVISEFEDLLNFRQEDWIKVRNLLKREVVDRFLADIRDEIEGFGGEI